MSVCQGHYFPSLTKVGNGAAPRELFVTTLEYLQEGVTGISHPKVDIGVANGLNGLPRATMRGMGKWEVGMLVAFSALPQVTFWGCHGHRERGLGLDLHCPLPASEDSLLSRIF